MNIVLNACCLELVACLTPVFQKPSSETCLPDTRMLELPERFPAPTYSRKGSPERASLKGFPEMQLWGLALLGPRFIKNKIISMNWFLNQCLISTSPSNQKSIFSSPSHSLKKIQMVNPHHHTHPKKTKVEIC